MKEKKWAVIWKRDKKILNLYGMKETHILSVEAQKTTSDRDILDLFAIFNTKKEAINWKRKNDDWEIVGIIIKLRS